jgi:hypothetical protein
MINKTMDYIILTHLLIEPIVRNEQTCIKDIFNNTSINAYISFRINDIYKPENLNWLLQEIKQVFLDIIKKNNNINKIFNEINCKINKLEDILDYDIKFKNLRMNIFIIFIQLLLDNIDIIKPLLHKLKDEEKDNIMYIIHSYISNYMDYNFYKLIYNILDKMIENIELEENNIEQDYKIMEDFKEYKHLIKDEIYDYARYRYLKRLNGKEYFQITEIEKANKSYYVILNDYVYYNLDKPDIEDIIYNNIKKMANIEIRMIEYKDIKIFLRIYNIFKIYIKLVENTNDRYIKFIKIYINNILGYEKNLLDYIINSLIILIKKLNETNVKSVCDIVKTFTTIINLSYYNNKFIEKFYINLQKCDININNLEYLILYLENIICDIENIEYNNILCYILDLKNNIKYKKEINKIKITNNKDIECDFNKCNFLIIRKLKNNIIEYNFKIYLIV